MKKNRFILPINAAIGLMLLASAVQQAPAETAQPRAKQASTALSPAAHQKSASAFTDDLAGFDLTDVQRSEIARIRRESESRKSLIARSTTLSEDQKSAMLVGYTRIENGEIFKVLTPAQQKEAREKALARRAAAKAVPSKPGPGR